MVSIKDERKKPSIFEDLVTGNYFMYEGVLYVVIDESVEKDNVSDDYYETDVVNVLELKSGLLYRISPQTVIEPVDVEITIL